MLFPLLVPALALFKQGQAAIQQFPVETNPNLTVHIVLTRLDPPKLSPKMFGDQRWEFDWMTRGYGNTGEAGVANLKLRVYSQERKEKDDKAPMVARMVMQIWDRSFHRLKLDHPQEYNNGIVDFFLCYGGDPGGEQLFGEEILPNRPQPVKVNTVYIYQLASFKDPIEMAREVAHEYDHAILPAVGGFKTPEHWSNGYLGEKLFLTWIRDEIAKGTLKPEDAMGASLSSLNTWVSNNVDAFVKRAATQPTDPYLVNEVKGGMDGFLGLAMYIEELCPPSVFLRSLLYTRDSHKGVATPPTDYAQQVLTAAAEVENLTLSVPPCVKDLKTIWIPLGKGTCQGATVVSRKDGWAEVAPLMPNIVIKNPPIH